MTFKKNLLILFSLLSFSILAQNDTIRLQSIEIISVGIPSLNSQSVRNIELLHDIKTFPAPSINDMLKYATNTDSRQRGSNGIQSDVSIRGGSYDETLILLNGIMMNDPQSGHHSMNLPVEIENIDHIEILNGPGARVWGMNAFSGAINLSTPYPLQNSAHFSVSAGEHNLLSNSLSLSSFHKNFGTYLAFNQKSCDGYNRNTDFNTRQLYIRSEYSGKYLHVDLQGGYTNKAFGANSFYSAKYPDQFENVVLKFTSISLSIFKTKNLSLKYYYRELKDKFELFRESPPSWYSGHNYHLTKVHGIDISYVFNWIIGKTSVGANFRSEQIYSNVLGNKMNAPIAVENESGVFYTRSKARSNSGIYINHSYNYKNLQIDAGIMGNFYSGKSFQYFPGIDIRYKVLKDLNFLVSYNKSFRLPTFTDLYYSGPSNQGNINLKPEEAQTIEAGLQFKKNNFQASLGAFQRFGSNMIDWVKHTDSVKWTTMNLTKVNVSGIELSLNYHFDKTSYFMFFIKAVELKFAYNNISKLSLQDYTSYYVLDGIHQKGTISILQGDVDHLYFNWYLNFQDRYGGYTDITTNKLLEYEPYFSLDVKVNYKLDVFNFYIECNNLTNAKYYDFGNILMPGRWIKGGISFNINFNKKPNNE